MTACLSRFPALKQTAIEEVEFVRRGLQDYFCEKYANHPCIPLAEALEKRLIASRFTADGRTGPVPLGDEEAEAIRDAVWTRLHTLPQGSTAVLLTTTSVGRAVLREIIAPEIPDLPVCARIELASQKHMQMLDTVDLQPPLKRTLRELFEKMF